MLKRLFLHYLFIALVVAMLGFTLKIQAQTQTCDLRISVFEFKAEQVTKEAALVIMDKTTVLPDAKAIAFNIKTKKTFNSILVDRVPYFRSLREGTYDVTVSKFGYKKLKQRISLQCRYANSENIFCESALLRKGNINQIISTPANVRDTARGYGENPGGCDYVLPPKPLPKLPPRIISGGVVNGKATNLVKPEYPAAARAVKASGVVNVLVTIDEEGNVISAEAASGHPLLRASAVQAARASKFSPTLLEGQPVKVTGVIVYNFVP